MHTLKTYSLLWRFGASSGVREVRAGDEREARAQCAADVVTGVTFEDARAGLVPAEFRIIECSERT